MERSLSGISSAVHKRLTIRAARRPIFVHVHDGYIAVSRGAGAPVYIPRKQLLLLLRSLVPLVKQMGGPSFDPEVAMREYLQQEEETSRELKRQKRGLREQARQRALAEHAATRKARRRAR